MAKLLYELTLGCLRKDNSRVRFQLPNWPMGTACGCGCGQKKNNCFEGQNLDDSWYAPLHSPKPTNEVTHITRSSISGRSFPTIATESSEERTWVQRSQVEISTTEIPALSQVVSNWKPASCVECGSRLDKKPIGCINRGHLMSYEKSRERARFRNAKSRRK